MNLGDLTNLVENSLGNLVEKPLAAVSHIVNTPNSAGRYRPFYLRNLLDAVQGRTLEDAVKGKTALITGGSSGIGEAAAKKIAEAGGAVALVARTRENLEKVADEIRGARWDRPRLPVRPDRHGRHRRHGRSGARRSRRRRHPDQQRGALDPALTRAVLRPDPRLPAHHAAELPRRGPADPQVHPRDARAGIRARHQRLLGRRADPRAALRGLHRQQGRAGQLVRRAAGRNRERRRAVHHGAHGAGAHADDQPDHAL